MNEFSHVAFRWVFSPEGKEETREVRFSLYELRTRWISCGYRLRAYPSQYGWTAELHRGADPNNFSAAAGESEAAALAKVTMYELNRLPSYLRALWWQENSE